MNFDNVISKYHNNKLFLGVYEYGFENMSEIQEKVLPLMLNKKDLIVQAQSGTGKSSLFTIGALAMIDVNIKKPQILIVLNTKELARQVQYIMMKIGKFINFRTTLCCGGNLNYMYENINNKVVEKQCVNIKQNIEEALKSHILIGTPGRIYDIMHRNTTLKDTMKMIIIDEADILLKNVINNDMNIMTIIDNINKEKQICLFSATYDKLDDIEKKLNNPTKILINNDDVIVNLIKNYYINITNNHEKYEKIAEIYTSILICQSIIFVNHKSHIKEIVKFFKDNNIDYEILTSDVPDIERINILTDFRNGKIRNLIATDIIGRGIDVQKVGLIINFDIPYDVDMYIHRIGRSGRYGRKGIAINLLNTNDHKYMDNILRKYNNIVFTELENIFEINL